MHNDIIHTGKDEWNRQAHVNLWRNKVQTKNRCLNFERAKNEKKNPEFEVGYAMSSIRY